ncbi:MAG: DUF4917 domain-containing protein [Nitrosomonadales bacterium SCN 54-20]|nr:MAG: DUF4917 domain-containing protein [Nitrosomonadales bacterium SCN 54-20]
MTGSVNLISFSSAIADARQFSKRHILLGNGFSIACRPGIFRYGRLYEQADFSKLSPSAKKAFETLRTEDFEKVIKALRSAASILKAYDGVDPTLINALKRDAEGLKELLVQTIANSHPEWPSEIRESEYAACLQFLSNFNTVYTLNYDLLLYWAQMHDDMTKEKSDDGFRKSEDDPEAPYVTWDPSNSHRQKTWFLHGALHLFDAETEIQKYTWINTGVRLIEQIRDALNCGLFPIFVSEGTSNEKLSRIRHNDYLAKAYRSFSEITGALFIYGHSLASNDDHFLKRIEKGKINKVYLGIYGDPNSSSNREIIYRAMKMPSRRKRGSGLSVTFFDTSSVKVW